MFREHNNYFGRQRFVLRMLGLSVYRNESVRYIACSYLLLTFVDLCPILQLGTIWNGDFDSTVHSLMFVVSSLIGVLKSTVFLRRRYEFGRVLEKIENEPFRACSRKGGKEEKKLMDACLYIVNIQSTVFWWLPFGIIGCTIYMFIIRIIREDSHHWRYPFGPFNLLNVTYSPNFEMAAIYQGISLFYIGMHFATYDIITGALLCHISNQFKMLQTRMKRVTRYECRKLRTVTSIDEQSLVTYTSQTSEHSWTYLRCIVKETVDQHVAIIQLAEEVEDLCSDVVFVALVSTLLLLGLALYSVLLLKTYKAQQILYWIMVIGFILQIGLYCYWGEQVSYESQLVGEAAFGMNLIDSDSIYQNALIMTMIRCQTPVSLSAGKIAVLSLPTLLFVLRSSYSAFAVIRSSNKS